MSLFPTTASNLNSHVAARLRHSTAGPNWLGEFNYEKNIRKDRETLRDIVRLGSPEDRAMATLDLRLSELAETGEFYNVHAHDVTVAGLKNFTAIEKSGDQKLASVVESTISSIIMSSTPQFGFEFIAQNGSSQARSLAQAALSAGRAAFNSGSSLGDYYCKNIYQSVAHNLALGTVEGLGGPAGVALASLRAMGGTDQSQSPAAEAMVRSLAESNPDAENQKLAQALQRGAARAPAKSAPGGSMLDQLRQRKPATASTLAQVIVQAGVGEEYQTRRAMSAVLSQTVKGGVVATPEQQKTAQDALAQGDRIKLNDLYQAVSSLV